MSFKKGTKETFEMCIRFEATDVPAAKLIAQFQAHKLGGSCKALYKVIRTTDTNEKGKR